MNLGELIKQDEQRTKEVMKVAVEICKILTTVF